MLLRILVPVKRTIDAAIKPRIQAGAIQTSGLKFLINPFDDIAVEEALKIKEGKKGLVESIHAVTIGPKKAEDILKNCLAKGVDKTTLVKTEDELEPLAVAKVLQKMVEKNNANVVIMGKQAIDDDCGQTGQLLAGLLGWAQASNASKVEITGEEATVHQEIDGGLSVVRAKLPLVVTTDLRLNTPRYVLLPKLMKAKKKPSEVVEFGSLQVDAAKRVETLGVEEPPKRSGGKIVGVSEVVEELKKRKLI